MVAPNSHSANINPVRENLQEQRASNNSASLFMLDFFCHKDIPALPQPLVQMLLVNHPLTFFW